MARPEILPSAVHSVSAATTPRQDPRRGWLTAKLLSALEIFLLTFPGEALSSRTFAEFQHKAIGLGSKPSWKVPQPQVQVVGTSAGTIDALLRRHVEA